MPELRIYNSDGAYFRLHLSANDAIRAAVELRKLNMGLTYYGENPMISNNINAFDAVELLLDKCDICLKRFKPSKTCTIAPIKEEKEVVKQIKSSNTITLDEYLTKISGFM